MSYWYIQQITKEAHLAFRPGDTDLEIIFIGMITIHRDNADRINAEALKEKRGTSLVAQW